MEPRSEAPRKKSTPINQLPDVQPEKGIQKPMMQQAPPQQRPSESENELVQRVLTSMQEPSQVNIQEKQAVVQEQRNNVKLDEINNDSKSEETLTNKLLKEGKEPLLIAGLAYLSNQPFVTDFIKKYVPKIVEAETNNITTLGFIIKALLVGLLFYIIKKYLLK
jgi:hypothetical protein